MVLVWDPIQRTRSSAFGWAGAHALRTATYLANLDSSDKFSMIDGTLTRRKFWDAEKGTAVAFALFILLVIVAIVFA